MSDLHSTSVFDWEILIQSLLELHVTPGVQKEGCRSTDMVATQLNQLSHTQPPPLVPIWIKVLYLGTWQKYVVRLLQFYPNEKNMLQHVNR